jgi:hypothetical protein
MTGVLAHERPFTGIQRPALVEHLVGHSDLADVVQQRDDADFFDGSGVQSEPERHGGGEIVDLVGMPARVAVTGLSAAASDRTTAR